MLVRLILNSWTQVICLPQSPKELRVQVWATAPGRCFHFVTLASPQCRVARGILLSCFLVYFPLQYWSLFNILFGCLSLPTKIYVRCYITSAWHIDSQYLLNEWMNGLKEPYSSFFCQFTPNAFGKCYMNRDHKQQRLHTWLWDSPSSSDNCLEGGGVLE